jgi:hypothetical protein
LALEVVTRAQMMVAVHSKRKLEFDAIVRQVSYSLSDPRTCYANLNNTALDSDLRYKGFNYFNEAGAKLGGVHRCRWQGGAL